AEDGIEIGRIAERQAVRASLAHLGSSPSSAGRAMVAVGDIQRGDALEGCHQRVAVGAAGAPDRVANMVGRLEVEKRRARGYPLRDPIDVAGCAIRQEYGSGLGAERDHMPRSIVLLVAPGPLVLLDDVAIV